MKKLRFGPIARFWTLGVALLGALALAVACGGAEPTPTATATTAVATPTATKTAATPTAIATTAVATPTATKTAATPTPTATPAPALAAVQEFRTNLVSEPATLDPNRSAFSTEITVVKQLFNGLLGFNQDLTVKAVAAEEVPSVANGGISADGKTYAFKLRKDAVWSDGQPVTAKDYVYSIKRMLSPDLAADYASFYYSITGAEEYNSAASADAATKATLRDGVDVRSAGDYILEIRLKAAESTFLPKMALWPVYPVRQDVIEKNGDKWIEAGNLIGNGPFLLKEWVHQDHITLEANPKYWGKKPTLKTILLKLLPDENAAMLAYRNGELDMVSVPAGNEKAILADPVLSKEVLRFNELTVFAFQYNVAKPPFDNKLVRQALATAVDRDAFVDKVRNGVGKTATAWLPPGMPGYDVAVGSQYKFDPAKAKKLLADAGFPDGKGLPTLTFSYSNTTGNTLIAQFLQSQMKENLGLDIKLDPQESRAFRQFLTENQHQWAFLGWGADYPDPENFLPGLFGTGAGNNHTLYSNAQFDALTKQATTELDDAKRLQMWKQAHQMVIDDAPIIPMFYRERFWVKKPNVLNLKTTGMDGGIPGDFFYVEVAIGK
ncbi:MAG: peptide ABC transporter substrate-binding protein [Chloroflexi bacterium]|nr:peptide ABC transporter substrate-binding protein [Chloroflexota bacterium]